MGRQGFRYIRYRCLIGKQAIPIKCREFQSRTNHIQPRQLQCRAQLFWLSFQGRHITLQSMITISDHRLSYHTGTMRASGERSWYILLPQQQQSKNSSRFMFFRKEFMNYRFQIKTDRQGVTGLKDNNWNIYFSFWGPQII